MRILYDISLLGGLQSDQTLRTGIARVIEELSYRLAADKENFLLLCAQKQPVPAFEFARLEGPLQDKPFAISRLDHMRAGTAQKLIHAYERVSAKGSAGRKLRIAGWYRLNRVLEAMPDTYLRWASEADVYHTPAWAIPTRIRRKGLRCIQTVYDFSPLRLPDVTTETQRVFVQTILDGLRDEDWVLADSQSAKDDLCEFRKFDPARVTVTYLAADQAKFYPCEDAVQIQAVRDKYRIPEGPYALSVCTLEPRKNLLHVVRCFAELLRQERVPGLNLVLAGGKGWMIDRLFEEVGALADFRDRIILTGFVDDEDLAALYTGAHMFLYLSLYEGFGLPPLEAMQCGTPVISSDTSALPEVVGDAGILLDPRDTDGLCQAIFRLHTDTCWRKELSLRGLVRARQFSWDRCAKETIAAYKTAINA